METKTNNAPAASATTATAQTGAAETPQPVTVVLGLPTEGKNEVALSVELALNLGAGEQDALMKRFSKSVKHEKDTRANLKDEAKYAAILLYGVEARVKRGIAANIYPSTKTASDVYKDVTGEKPPGHVWTLKETVANYVATGKITEPDYLGNRNNCLELAQRIVNAVIEYHPAEGLMHDAVSRAATELKTRTDKEAKNLRAILDSVKPKVKMSAEDALAAYGEIFAAGHLAMCLVTTPDMLEEATEILQKETYVALAKSLEQTDVALGAKVEAWSQEVVAAQAPVTLVTENGTSTVPPSEAPAAPAADAPAPVEAEAVAA